MSDKSFKTRVKEEAESFDEIYARFQSDLITKRDEGLVENSWVHLFAVPFGDSLTYEKPKAEDLERLNVRHKHYAARKAVEELGLHKRRLGMLEIKDEHIGAALDLGLLTPEAVAPPSGAGPSSIEGLVSRYKVSHDDPVFWRTLLEILCRAFVALPGRPGWTLFRYIDLAFDLDEIRRDLPGARWNKDDVLKALKTREPYKTKYKGTYQYAGVGEDRVQKITDLIGQMDDEALLKLARLFPDETREVAEARLRNDYLDNYDLNDIFNEALHAHNAIHSSLRRRDDG